MGKWLVAAAMTLPLVARADPLPSAPLPSAPAAAAPAPQLFTPKLPPDLTFDDTGWGLRATVQGRSMDLDSPGQGWARDPGAGAGDIVAGYGWRSGTTGAVIGYGQFDHGPLDAPTSRRSNLFRPREDDPGVLGLSFVLHR